MNYLTSLLATVSLSQATGRPASPAGPEATVQAYFGASDRCSARQMRTAFHPAAYLRWVDQAGVPQSLTQLAWWQRLEGQERCRAALGRELEVLDQEGPLVLVEATARYETHRFHDLLLVVETPQGWRIVDKVFDRLGPDEKATVGAGDDADIRKVVAEKIEAHAAYDPALLASSHLPDCTYSRVHVEGTAYERVSLSEAADRYASRRERGESDRTSPWRVLLVRSAGRIAAVKLEVLYRGIRYVDHLLLVRTASGWRIAAAAWGDPLRGARG